MSAAEGSDVIFEEEALGKAYDTRLLVRLWPYVRPYLPQVIATIALVIPMLALELAPAWIVKTGLDRLFASLGIQQAVSPRTGIDGFLDPPAGVAGAIWIAGLYLCAMALNAGLMFVRMVLMTTTGQAAMRDLRRETFDHIQTLHMGFFDRYPVGRLVTRVTNDVENVAEMFSQGIVAFVTDLVLMLGLAIALFVVNPKLAGMTFLVVPVLAVVAVVFRLKVREAFRSVRVRIARINAHIQETITGMKVVQLFNREKRNQDDFDLMNADHRDAWKRSIRYDAALFAAVEAAQGVTVAIIIWYGTGLAEPGVLYVFIDWMRRFFMPLRDLSAKYSVMQSSMASAERIFQLLDSEPEIRDAAPGVYPEQPSTGERGATVEFQNVWFAYQPGEWVLRDLSFEVGKGESVAVVGATGAGKTTLISLLTRLYEVNRGRILVDGVDIREIPQVDLRARIATVLQDVFLFSGTLEENISLNRPGIGHADVVRASESVQADVLIRQLPDGYSTEVRERGTNFSAGERQLLSFARALARDADILVLDEATSSIDTETETLIQQGIHVLMKGRTAIAIAHRLSTIRDVDRIYVLQQGELVESGRHEELLARGGVYERLYRLQYQGQDAAPERVSA